MGDGGGVAEVGTGAGEAGAQAASIRINRMGMKRGTIVFSLGEEKEGARFRKLAPPPCSAFDAAGREATDDVLLQGDIYDRYG